LNKIPRKEINSSINAQVSKMVVPIVHSIGNNSAELLKDNVAINGFATE